MHSSTLCILFHAIYNLQPIRWKAWKPSFYRLSQGNPCPVSATIFHLCGTHVWLGIYDSSCFQPCFAPCFSDSFWMLYPKLESMQLSLPQPFNNACCRWSVGGRHWIPSQLDPRLLVLCEVQNKRVGCASWLRLSFQNFPQDWFIRLPKEWNLIGFPQFLSLFLLAISGFITWSSSPTMKNGMPQMMKILVWLIILFHGMSIPWYGKFDMHIQRMMISQDYC